MPPGCPMASFTFVSRKNYIVLGTLIHSLLMATSKLALGILLRGLQKLKKDVEERRERLQKELKAKQKISEEDEAWLDGAGNLVDEERVIQLLKDAADYEKGLEQLSNGDRDVVERLKALGDSGGRAEGPGVAGKKRKRTALNSIHMSFENLIPDLNRSRKEGSERGKAAEESQDAGHARLYKKGKCHSRTMH
jgi:hypothetical protein